MALAGARGLFLAGAGLAVRLAPDLPASALSITFAHETLPNESRHYSMRTRRESHAGRRAGKPPAGKQAPRCAALTCEDTGGWAREVAAQVGRAAGLFEYPPPTWLGGPQEEAPRAASLLPTFPTGRRWCRAGSLRPATFGKGVQEAGGAACPLAGATGAQEIVRRGISSSEREPR